LAGFEHWPVAGSHVPAEWHVSSAAHTTALPPTHTPLWQVSLRVQRLLSSHTGPESSAQIPSCAAPAATEQASHGPALHVVLQQTPSEQNPLKQSVARTHPPPSGAPPPKSSVVAVALTDGFVPPVASTLLLASSTDRKKFLAVAIDGPALKVLVASSYSSTLESAAMLSPPAMSTGPPGM